MSFYTKMKLVLGLILAFIISYLTYQYLTSLNNETTIVVATQDIDARSWIKPHMLKEIKIRVSDKKVLAPDSFTSIEELGSAISKVKILKDTVIRRKEDVILGTMSSLKENKVVNEDGQINEAYFVSDNQRMVTVHVDSQGAVGNQIKAGDYVDVLVTFSDTNQKSFSSMILQHIEVFDVEHIRNQNSAAQASQNITLVLSPQQAVDLTFAKRTGKLDLALNPVKGNNEVLNSVNIEKFIEFSKNEE